MSGQSSSSSIQGLKFDLKQNTGGPAIEVVPYDPHWPELFAQEAAQIKQALGDNCITIHHIGSTSVPGLSAKPVIDMVPVVQDILKVKADALEPLGYTGRGELGMLFRRYFSNKRTHVHIWEEGNPQIEKQLVFRDYLIQHPLDAKRYEALKLQLVQKYRDDRNTYTLSKDDLIKEILNKAGFQGLGLVQALTPREWDAVKKMRNEYFFDPLGIPDPYTWSFEDENHFHIVFSKGTENVGYAHLQFWPEHRAAMRIIVIEETYRNQGLGRQFLQFLELWLTHQGIKSLHIESSPKALSFYCHADYVDMPFNDPEGHPTDPNDTAIGKVLGLA